MSNFTTQVRYICEQMYDGESHDASDINDIVESTASDIIGSYPIFDEQYRKVLDTKIIKHFYTREIGYETVSLWKFKLNTRMNEIMPYFNKLYKSELLDFNPLYDVDLKTEHEKMGNESGQEEKERNVEDERVSSESGVESKTKNGSVTTSGKESGDESESGDSSRNATGSESSEQKNETVGSETSNREASSENSGSTSAEVEGSAIEGTTKGHLDKYLDTPQGGIANLLSGDYLTNARDIAENENKTKGNKESTTGSTSGSGTEKENANSSSSNLVNAEGKTESETKEIEKSARAMSSRKEREENEESSGSEEGRKSTSGNESGSVNEKSKGKNFVTSTENYLEKVSGKRGSVSYSKLLGEYRDTFLNIDVQVIERLDDLFMSLWE